MGFMPCGVITLTTDFGHKGVFAGAMKGQVLRRFPAARFVDITHEILAHWPDEAGFWLARSFRYFPDGTVHVAVVDPGVGTSRDILVMENGTQLFLAPDNGLLGWIDRDGDARTYRLDMTRLADYDIVDPSSTFHGRDIFAPLAAEIASGRIDPAQLGPPAGDIVPRWQEPPAVNGDTISGVVLTIDTFGNLITNIDAALLDGIDDPLVVAGGRQIPLHETYGEVAPGEYLALINSFSVLEIARAEKSATEGLGLGRGAPVLLRPAG